MTQDYRARFSGIATLLGQDGLEKLRRSHCLVIGIGGVGSWALESLARSAVGSLSFVDMDDVCVSNTNRQLHAIEETYGKKKVSVMKDRLEQINPQIRSFPIYDFFTESTSMSILSPQYDYIIDAIDNLKYKAHLIRHCLDHKKPLITIGAAGGHQDPTTITIGDLAATTSDQLMKRLRKIICHSHPHLKGRQKFGIDAVYSTTRIRPQKDPQTRRSSCEITYGSASFMTGAMGLAAASHAVREICGR